MKKKILGCLIVTLFVAGLSLNQTYLSKNGQKMDENGTPVASETNVDQDIEEVVKDDKTEKIQETVNKTVSSESAKKETSSASSQSKNTTKQTTTVQSSSSTPTKVEEKQPVTKNEQSNPPSSSKPSDTPTNEDLIKQLEGDKKEETVCIAATTGYPSEGAAYQAAINEITQYEATHEGITGSCGAQQHYDECGHSYWTYWVTYN